MKFVNHYFPGLVSSVGHRARDETILENRESSSTPEPETPVSTPRGLAIHLEPDTVFTAEPDTPWKRCPLTLAEVGGRAQVAFIGGTSIEAARLASEVELASSKHLKTKTRLFRRLWRAGETSEIKELQDAAEVFDGFLVPPNPGDDMANVFEKTRRRVRRLVESAVEEGWTRAPLIAMESPNPEFSERIPPGLCDYLVLESDPVPTRHPAPHVVAGVKIGEHPWWSTSPNHLYSISGTTLWWASWMMNPLTFGAQHE